MSGYIVMYDILVLTLLFTMVLLVAWGRVRRYLIGVFIVLTLLVFNAVSLDEVIEYVNWDVLGLILGMSIFSVFLEVSGIAEVVARYLVYKVRNTFVLFLSLILAAGIVSIVLENVTTVLLFAPIVFKIGRITRVNIIPLMIGVALSANMSGSATMVGDPPAIITAGHYDLSFTDFIFYKGRPSMFFITLIPMIVSCLTYTYFYIKKGESTVLGEIVFDGKSLWSGIDKAFVLETVFFLSIKILLLSIRDIIHIPLSFAAAVGVGGLALTRLIIHKDYKNTIHAFKNGFEWELLVFLAGVFVLSGAFAKYGLAERFAKILISLSGNNLFFLTAILIWFSVAVSAVLDNVPYVATMLPVIDGLSRDTGVDPIVYAWALLLGATLGGGITYIGASANLVTVRLLEKHGNNVSFTGFVKYSLPFNIVNIFTGWALFIIFWLA